MKVRELLQEKAGASYKPRYDADLGIMRGSALDWLDSIGAKEDDIKKALDRLKATPLFRNELPKMGIIYDPTPIKEKKGTLQFKVTTLTSHTNPAKVFNTTTMTYSIYANGQIRQSGSKDPNEAHTRLKAPKPSLIAGNVVGSIVKTWTGSLEELLNKRKVQMDREERLRVKKEKMDMKEEVELTEAEELTPKQKKELMADFKEYSSGFDGESKEAQIRAYLRMGVPMGIDKIAAKKFLMGKE